MLDVSALYIIEVLILLCQFYASSREHLQLRWYMRLAIYAIPMAAFLTQMLSILQALRCQTSPDFAQIRYGDPLKHLAIDFASEGGFLYRLSTTMLFWQDDASCCAARHMSLTAIDGDKSGLRGSLSLLFKFFMTICASQLVETLACALQGQRPVSETGMTIFEHSLAFAECEAMISSALGFGFFGLPKLDSATPSTGKLVTRSEILHRLNVPPEVLLVCLISCLSHLSSAALAITGIRHRVRLVNTAIWSICYMTAFIWSFLNVILNDSITDLGVLRFPTVCVMGFIPHIMILIGIVVCGLIYASALLVTVFSIPEDAAEGLTFQQRIAWAYGNLQANVQFSSTSSIRISMAEDFYTTLLKIGFNVLTAASEAVFLNEGSRVQVAEMTWIEQKRIEQLATSIDRRRGPAVPTELLGDGIAKGVGFADHQNVAFGLSPYARERKSKPVTGDANKGSIDNGLGINQRRSRMQLTYDFISGIFWLVTGLQAQLALTLLIKAGIDRRPAWLLKAASHVGERRGPPVAETRNAAADDLLFLLRDDDADVESEMRQRLRNTGADTSEESLSEHLYGWWGRGGWFGNVDSSGEYQAREMDDDLTSMVSMSTNASNADDRSDASGSGRRTPTQDDPYADRETTPAHDTGLDMSLLSRLLNPQTPSDRDEARLLAHSLQSDRAMTRSRYRKDTDRARAQLLSGLRSTVQQQQSSEDEEERDLEQFILSQRAKARAKATKSKTWDTGAEGMGEGGPQCVVCQSAPRTILVWPCGCLSMCDDCRTGLALRNTSACICCRTEVAAYSRLYVP